MAHSLSFQDWTTVKGGSTTTSITQNEHLWADLRAYRDLMVHLEVADFAGTPRLQFQTAPTKDTTLFQLIDAAASFDITLAVVYPPVLLLYSQVAVPIARYVRWKFTGSLTSPWSCTFRIVLSPVLS